ncbi:CDP-alcohol phosphatidyltransferase family protein [Sphingobacteriales bacterium UPWRP_1]|nr:hypothetical protein B6N25_05990 [Sphingobacteriales bacterium TSM_CSS]PSJ78623.1 CDP-alcohol phosphatidyltransferase family protein [Sphingobacteriales bacterium UPWRP_1]
MPTASTSSINLANALCVFRLCMALLLPVLAWQGQQMAFLYCLAAALFSDAIDGFIARKLQQTSQLGTKLDSWADLTLFITTPLGAWLLWPHVIAQERVYVAMILLALIVPIAFGLVKYGRITSYHTYMAKTSGVLMGFSSLLLLFNITPWPFRFAAVFMVAEALEEIAITATLPQWTSNVPTLKHARRLVKKERIERQQ